VQDNNDASFKAVEGGQADAFVTDDILLFGLIGKSAKPADYEVVGKYISIEPYALMIRKDDGRFKGVVNRALNRVYKSGEIKTIYNRWFVNGERNIPMSLRLKESITQPNSAAAFP
jgi:glutamate/aspartate transport system substrate-binding protein